MAWITRIIYHGLPWLQLSIGQTVEVAPASSLAIPVSVRVDPTGLKTGSHMIVFHVIDADRPDVAVSEKSRFFVR